MLKRITLLGAVCLFIGGFATGQSVVNWSAPLSWSPASAQGQMTTMDVTPPLPFIGLAPCRIADTRGNGFTGAYGPPAMAAGSPRNFTLSGQCGIPVGAGAVSLNITVTNTAGPGFIKIFPQAGASPVVSTLNYVAGQTVANAAVVPLGTGGGVTVSAGVSGTQLIIDTNGYYASAPANQSSTFKVINNGLSTVPAIWGENDGAGVNATGVYGRALSGVSNGIWGENFSTADISDGVFGVSEATTGKTVGVWGRTLSSTGGAIGTYGEAIAGLGVTYGVEGVSLSLAGDSAGVKGVSGALGPVGGTGFRPAGIRGDSGGEIGVEGITNSGGAVLGFLVNGAGVIAYGALGSTFDMAADATVGPWGVFSFGTLGASGTKHFVEPHPTDATKEILYASLEGREVGTYFRGTSRTVGGEATVAVPADFRMVTAEEGLTVQVTPFGDVAAMGVISKSLNQIVVRSSKDVSFDYLIQGVRKGYEGFEPVQSGRGEFVPRTAQDRMPAYLNAEQKRKLIANGTYNEDGTVNLATAERVGWAKLWADRAALAKAEAETARRSAVNRR